MEGVAGKPIKGKRNKCKHCRMASYCLPALLDKASIKKLKSLNFSARFLDPGEHLCYQGKKIDSVFFIRSGVLKSYINKEDGHECIMDFYFPPELFGWEGSDKRQLSFSIMALDYSNVCEIPLAEFGHLLSEEESLQTQFFNLIHHRIRSDNQKFLRTTAEQRVASFIVQLTRHYKRQGFPYSMCNFVMTHQDIANYLRIAPATISRILHHMEKQSIITLSHKKLYLNNLDLLYKIAEGVVHTK